MNLKLKGTITLNNDEVCIMLDHKDEIVDKINCQCDDHQPCFPHSREVCQGCYDNLDEFREELQRQAQDERDRGDWYHDEQDGYAPNVQYFPDNLTPETFYRPVNRGLEIKIREKLERLKERDSEYRSRDKK